MEDSKVIKISNENYIWLARLAAELQKQRGKLVSFDEAITEIKKEKGRKNIMELAGSWKITEKEAEEIKNNLKKGWSSWKIKSA